jgi:predicted nucleic acid-binding protein
MTVPHFVDTNILIYAASKNPKDQAKREKAAELIASIEFGVSAQVLAEFYVNVTNKGAPPMTPDVALRWLDRLQDLPCVALDAGLVRRGIEISKRYQISYRDGAILADAEALGAPVLFTEDLNHGQGYGAVTVVNPFLPA